MYIARLPNDYSINNDPTISFWMKNGQNHEIWYDGRKLKIIDSDKNITKCRIAQQAQEALTYNITVT